MPRGKNNKQCRLNIFRVIYKLAWKNNVHVESLSQRAVRSMATISK